MCNGKVHTGNLARHQAEERSRQLKGELSAARAEEGVLRHEITSLSTTVERLTKKLAQSKKEVKKAWSVLYKLGPDPYDCDVTC